MINNTFTHTIPRYIKHNQLTNTCYSMGRWWSRCLVVPVELYMTVSVSVRCWVGPMCACMRVPAVLHAYNTAYIHAEDACSKGVGV